MKIAMIMVLLFDLASCLMRNGCVHVSIHTHVQLVPNSAKTGESRSLVVSLCVPIAPSLRCGSVCAAVACGCLRLVCATVWGLSSPRVGSDRDTNASSPRTRRPTTSSSTCQWNYGKGTQ